MMMARLLVSTCIQGLVVRAETLLVFFKTILFLMGQRLYLYNVVIVKKYYANVSSIHY